MQLLPVPPEHLGVVWAHLSEEIESIAERSGGRLTSSDIRALLEKGDEMFAWVAIDDAGRLAAICLAEVAVYPRAKVCRLVGCAGRSYEKWLPLLSGIEDWARSIGCTQMHAIARKGWAKKLTDYALTHYVMEKHL